MRRRRYLGALSALATGATAGCLGELTGGGRSTPVPTVADRPDAVYVPPHVHGMQMAGMGTAGDLKVGLSYSFPHRFWLITGTGTEQVTVREQDSVHIMVSLWDPETGAVPPAGSVSTTLTRNGETVADKRMWPMLSQNMGVHFGDNVALDGDGTYQVEVSVGPVGVRRTGAFAGQFGATASTTIEMAFSQSELEEVMYRQFEDRAGERDAADRMEMEMLPLAEAPVRGTLPGSLVGETTSGDAVFLATTLPSPPDGVDGEGTYLAVSPRTPYNRYPLPLMTVSGTLTRDGETAFDDALPATLDPDLGLHYGADVGELAVGDELSLSVGVPPQLARHEGYETAFLEMPSMAMSVS
jgi:uncharacterized protein involved in high-affinity Fe2+ transport